MLKKTLTYHDLDNNHITEDFYFNLSLAELIDMELEYDGGLEAELSKITQSNDRVQQMRVFKQLILKSVGKRSDDNKRFVKNAEISDEFYQSGAYSAFFLELITETGTAVEFVNGIMPKDLMAKAAELQAGPAKVAKTVDQYSEAELRAMPQVDFDRLVGTDPKKWNHDVLLLSFQRKTSS